MHALFIMIKCELGKTYEVADELMAKIEEVSELYSTSGQYDLLVKCYLAKDRDVGRFVTDMVQTVPYVRDTYTIMTFNAFTG